MFTSTKEIVQKQKQKKSKKSFALSVFGGNRGGLTDDAVRVVDKMLGEGLLPSDGTCRRWLLIWLEVWKKKKEIKEKR